MIIWKHFGNRMESIYITNLSCLVRCLKRIVDLKKIGRIEMVEKIMPQPQQRRIWASSVTYTTAHGNTRSLTHWARPGIEPAFSWILVIHFCYTTMGTPGSFVCNRQKLKTPQVSINRWMNKQTVGCSYEEVLSNKKKWVIDTCYNMAEFQKNVEWKKADVTCILCHTIYIKF